MAKLTKDKVKGKKALQTRLIFPDNEEDETLLTDAKNAAQRARFLGDKDEIKKADEALREVEEAVGERGLVFVFRGIGRKPYEKLLRLHGPTEEQKAKAKDAGGSTPQWDTETFPAALCHASAVDSELSAEDWIEDVFESEEWGPGELAALFNAAIDVNSDRRVHQLGN